jgi:hypothetical protein
MNMPLPRRSTAVACALAVLLAACGGGGDGGGNPPPLTCSVADQQVWLSNYFDDNYFWYAISPKPSPSAYSNVDAFFDALLYGGGDPIPGGGGLLWPKDRYSFHQSTTSFNQFFGDGKTLGYGVAVNGLEASAQGATRLFVRYIEPLSPAAQSPYIAGGLQRGDEIVMINGVPVATLIAANNGQGDYSALTANAAGDLLRLDVKRGTAPQVTVIVNAAVFALTPLQNNKIVQSPGGKRMGYVFVKDMISQVNSPLATAMAGFKSQGIDELVLDLRYNGGGLVSVGANLASYAAGARGSGQVYTRLLYNDKQQASNLTTLFSNPNAWSGFSKVYVLMGARTCSASEQVINGLRGVGIDAVGIGDTSCGKPVGFLPRDNACGTTYNVVNFESVNARNEGRYFDGLAPTCGVAEDFSRPVADLADPLLVSAAAYADSGLCPILAGRELPQSRSLTQRARYSGADGGERTGMSAR